MGNAFQEVPKGFMTVKEVEEFLGITYQVFRNLLKPSNFDYSSNCSGMPKNLYNVSDVEAFDKLFHYYENKDRYNASQVAKLVGRSPAWVIKEIKPSDQVVRGDKKYSFYDKKLIQQFIDAKNGVVYADNFEYEKRIKVLEERIKELENRNTEVEFGISDLIEALKNQTIKVKINKPV